MPINRSHIIRRKSKMITMHIKNAFSKLDMEIAETLYFEKQDWIHGYPSRVWLGRGCH